MAPIYINIFLYNYIILNKELFMWRLQKIRFAYFYILYKNTKSITNQLSGVLDISMIKYIELKRTILIIIIILSHIKKMKWMSNHL